jgi:hypothetical protein
VPKGRPGIHHPVDEVAWHGGPVVSGVAGGVDEPAFPAHVSDRCPASLRRVVHGHDMCRGKDTGGNPLDGRHGGPVTEPRCNSLDELRLRERRVRERQLGLKKIRDPLVGLDQPIVERGVAVWARNPLRQPPPALDGGLGPWRQGGDQTLGSVGPPPGIQGLGLPHGVEPLALHLRLVPAGGQHGGLTTPGRRRGTGRGQPRVPLPRPLREPVTQRLRHSGDLGHMPTRPPRRPQQRGHLRSHRCLEDLASGPGVPVQLGVHESRPAPVDTLDQVRQQHVPVQ